MPNLTVKIYAYDYDLQMAIEVRTESMPPGELTERELFLSAVGHAYDRVMAEIGKREREALDNADV